ncbi:ribosomal L7Ae/L30e/S12e/Gadd45 family protein [Candidatus Woesearchaeota archaeon]|nr:ribosomal L7Ae/L30e/S12e/Gadd45 family protein [Candidatus Woesearchaeota archaeon]
MAKKTITTTELKKLLKENNPVIGTDKTIKSLKRGKISKVIITSNCPEKVQEDIEHYSGLAKAEVLKTKYPNDELGVICKKPFAISVLSILKGTPK